MAEEKKGLFGSLKDKLMKKEEEATPSVQESAAKAAIKASTEAAAKAKAATEAVSLGRKPEATPASSLGTVAQSLAAKKEDAEKVLEIAKEVIRGDWGNGQERKDKLAAAGYDYDAIQAKVNELLK